MAKQNGKVSQALIDRVKAIADDLENPDAADAFRALMLLRKFKRLDDFEDNKNKADKDGWFQGLYNFPKQYEKVEVLRDGVSSFEQYDGERWMPYNDWLSFGTVLRPQKWRYVK